MDLLYLFITAVSAFFVVLVAALVADLRRSSSAAAIRTRSAPTSTARSSLELTWTFIPFVLSMVMFVWGADLFFRLARPPADAMDIFVVGKQWMWKVQHPTGVREINEMHVPIGRNVRIYARLGRRHPRLLDPGVPREDGRGPRQAHDDVVQGDGAGHVSPVLRGVLRHEALGHDRRRSSRWSRRTTRRGSPAAARPVTGGAERRAAVHRRSRARPATRPMSTGRGPSLARRVRQHGAAGRRPQGRGRRQLPARVDHELAGQGREGLPAASCRRSRAW